MQTLSTQTKRLLTRLLMVSVVFMQGCQGVRSDRNIDEPAPYDITTIFDKENVIPLAIIGSGPAGLGAALYGVRDNIKTMVFEGDSPGGLLMYTTDIENWPGEKSITGPDLMSKLRGSVEHLGAEFLADTVASVDLAQWPFVIKTVNDRTFHALSLVITTGASPRKLGVPGEEQFWGRGVTACAVCDARFFKGEDVVVVGGGDSAVEEALQLANHAKNITILVRKGEMKAAARGQKHLEEHPNINIMYNVEVKKIEGSGDKVTGVELINHATGKTEHFPTAGVFLAIGHIPNSTLFKGSLAMNEAGYIKTLGRTHHTSVPGVFAAGEVEDYRYRQAGSSSGDGTKAGLDALAFLREIGFNPTIAGQLSGKGKLLEEKITYQIPSLSTTEAINKELEESTVPVIFDFYTQNCPSCVHLLPLLNSVAKKFADSIKIFKIDADEADVKHLVEKYHIYNVPFLMVFDKGNPVARFTPAPDITRNELELFVEQIVKGKGQ